MVFHNGLSFTTKDSDNDLRSIGNCALLNSPSKPNRGWWFSNCWDINPNNFYNHGDDAEIDLNRKCHSVTFIEIIKIRPHTCN